MFVDYDLIELDGANYLTGEDVAYLLRCFSKCGVIVLLNPPDLGTRFFDLKLRRSMDSWADLVLGSEQLNNRWLWTDDKKEFAPWGWPRLAHLVSARRWQITAIASVLHKPVLDLLSFPKSARLALDHVMAEPVTRRPQDSHGNRHSEELTAMNLVLDSVAGVHRKDRAGLERLDSQIPSIAAARISFWLENVVLPAQSVLVDAPHLVSRLPALLASSAPTLSKWNSVIARIAVRPVG
ncbi:MAG: hypothetical protein IPK67_17325 [Planctomycetes bacterium]|nr:hypothetical protein [Planctomycetota bacterium]